MTVQECPLSDQLLITQWSISIFIALFVVVIFTFFFRSLSEKSSLKIFTKSKSMSNIVVSKQDESIDSQKEQGINRFKKAVRHTLDSKKNSDFASIASQIFILDRFRSRLTHNGKIELRDAFLSIDTRKFGQISFEQFKNAFFQTENFSDFTDDQMHLLFRLADVAGNDDGMVDYHEFFDLFGREFAELLLDNREDDIKQVIIITRHGARFPLKSFPHNSSWPRKKVFWKKFNGCLTPVGHRQHYSLGQRLARRYVGSSKLLNPNFPEFASWVNAYTSSSDRTLGSAQSMLLGLLPTCAQCFRVENEDIQYNQRNVAGIAIYIADEEQEKDTILHGFKESQKFNQLKKKAIQESAELDKYAASEEVNKLLNKLWEITGFEKINPSRNPRDKIEHLQSIAQEIDIERAHQMEILANELGIRMTLEDENLIREIANRICYLRYQGLNDSMQVEMSRLASGLLPKVIVESIKSTLSSQDNIEDNRKQFYVQQSNAMFVDAFKKNLEHFRKEKKLVFFSAHDNTIMALLSHFGIKDWPIPYFASFILIELHGNKKNGVPFVKMAYNPNPSDEEFETDPVEPHFFRKFPNQEILHFEEVIDPNIASPIEIPADEFIKHLMNTKQSFDSVEEWLQASAIDPTSTSDNNTNENNSSSNFFEEGDKGEE